MKIDVRFEGGTVWLTQQQMADLFQTTKQNVSLHIQNVFSERELPQDSVVKESLTTAADGKNYATKFYDLDVIISVGYRVKSHRGRQGGFAGPSSRRGPPTDGRREGCVDSQTRVAGRYSTRLSAASSKLARAQRRRRQTSGSRWR